MPTLPFLLPPYSLTCAEGSCHSPQKGSGKSRNWDGEQNHAVNKRKRPANFPVFETPAPKQAQEEKDYNAEQEKKQL